MKITIRWNVTQCNPVEVSEEHTTSIFKAEDVVSKERTKASSNVDKFIPDETASHARR
jgi:hypothetical protein